MGVIMNYRHVTFKLFIFEARSEEGSGSLDLN